jgi:hypothetical protein
MGYIIYLILVNVDTVFGHQSLELWLIITTRLAAAGKSGREHCGNKPGNKSKAIERHRED